jgi:SAM-dependent methyltransferase
MNSYTFQPQGACLMCLSSSSRNPVLGLRLNCRQGWKPRLSSGFAVTIRRCSSCRLTYPDPLPVPGCIEDHYAVPPESYWTDDYFNLSDDYLSGETSSAKRLLAQTAFDSDLPLKALDVGAAIGKGMIALERAGFEAWGLEPSPTFRCMAMDRMGIQPDRLQLASIEEANWPSDHFHYITFGAVLEHLYDPALCIQRALSWLKPGGIIHAEVPSSDYLIHRLLNGYYRLIGANYVANLSPMHSPYHLYEFTPQSFLSLGKRLGFRLAQHSYHPASGRFVPSLLYPLLYRLMTSSDTGMQLTVWLRKESRF